MSQNVQNTLSKMFLVWEEDCLVLLCLQLIHIVNQWSKNSILDKRAFGVCFRYLMWLFFFFRVFSDRLIDAGDHEAFVALLSDKLGTMFDLTFHNLCPNKQPPIFGKSLSLTRGFLTEFFTTIGTSHSVVETQKVFVVRQFLVEVERRQRFHCFCFLW